MMKEIHLVMLPKLKISMLTGEKENLLAYILKMIKMVHGGNKI